MANMLCYTLTFDPIHERFDTSHLNADSAWSVNDVVHVEMFSYEGLPRLVVLVRASRRPESRGDYRAMLRASERPLFDRLRQWRASTARHESIAAHRVASNRVLASLAALRPSSLSTMLEVPGIGPQTVRRYGAQLLDIVSRADETAASGRGGPGASTP